MMSKNGNTLQAVIVCGALLLAVAGHAQQVNPIQDAQTLGIGKGTEIYNMTRGTPVTTATVPGYGGANVPQTGYFQGGKGELSGPGSVRAAGCSGQAGEECDAVNLLNWGPTNRPRPTFNASDPLFQGFRNTQINASATVGTGLNSPSGNAAGALTGQTRQVCQPVQVPKPAEYADEICNESVQLEERVCSSERQVSLDPQTTYRCLQIKLQLETKTCGVDQQVTVDAQHTYECLNRIAQESQQKCDVNRQVEVAWNYPYECVQETGTQTSSSCNVDRFVQLDPKTTYQCVDELKKEAVTSCAVARDISVRADYDYDCEKASQKRNTYTCQKTEDPIVTWNQQITSACVPGSPATVLSPSGTNQGLSVACNSTAGIPTSFNKTGPSGPIPSNYSPSTCPAGYTSCWSTIPVFACSRVANSNWFSTVRCNASGCTHLYWGSGSCLGMEGASTALSSTANIPVVTERLVNGCTGLEARQ
jgi:hypothetical protein